jgi:hypothetical protein
MGTSNEDNLLVLWEQNTCPYCGREIAEGTRVGTGRKSDGGFCSLDCYTKYYQSQLVDRSERIAAAFQRHKNS